MWKRHGGPQSRKIVIGVQAVALEKVGHAVITWHGRFEAVPTIDNDREGLIRIKILNQGEYFPVVKVLCGQQPEVYACAE
jgi:hypothetical protein